MGQFESILDGFDEADRRGVLEYDCTLHGVAEKIKSGHIRRIVVLAGAGLSSSAGIPDFRSPETGLYNNLQEFDLPEPEDMFDISYFKKDPRPFYRLAKSIYPKDFFPTLGHYFLRLLEKKRLLLRCYTQNIDTLERLAGLTPKTLVEAHGSFATAHCSVCREACEPSVVAEALERDEIPRCRARPDCEGVVKPGIIFFGESLPQRFTWLSSSDLMAADLLLIIGTSLQVEPCSRMVNRVNDLCARMLWNREAVGPFARLAPTEVSPPPPLPSIASSTRPIEGVVSTSPGVSPPESPSSSSCSSSSSTTTTSSSSFATSLSAASMPLPSSLGGVLDAGRRSLAGVRGRSQDNYRDVLCLGEIDSLALAFARELGWERTLLDMQKRGNQRLLARFHPERVPPSPFGKFKSGVFSLFQNLTPRDGSDKSVSPEAELRPIPR